MSTRTLGLSDALNDYVVAHSRGEDPVLQEVAAITRARFADKVELQIAPEQGALMEMLTALCRPRLAVEVGTFTGYSSVCIARGLPPGGRLRCFDASDEWTVVARDAWARAGLTDRITLTLGDAVQTLPAALVDETDPVGFAFIDADKEQYLSYYETLLAHLDGDGLIAVDNTLARGSVVDPAGDEHAETMTAFNRAVAEDDRVSAVLVPIADGLTLIRRA